MSKKWHKGPPPSAGWWPASRRRDGRELRWWDGEFWSIRFEPSDSGGMKAKDANTPLAKSPFPGSEVEWKHRPASWPERSRT